MPDQLELVTAALADHYAVERELGAGGMATVYLARDLKHGRLVAVKVLHPDLAASLGAERFLREIQITAKLSHPHILPLYDSGAAGGFLFYVMPFVEGESLAARVEREKQLPIRDAVDITREVAQALAHAHSLGLVHRDIKPDNIMLSGGHAVIADFGIARALDAASADKLTQTGMAVGTPAYMSPEQAAGEGEVDGRADLYSLGCVLYEMLVGQIPFTGPTAMAIMARHTMDNVPPPTIMRQAIPDELEDVIMTAMAKSAADRYRTGTEMADALGAVDTHTAMHRRPSMAAQRRSSVLTRPGVAALPGSRWKAWGVAGGVTAAVLGAAGAVVFFTTGGGASARAPGGPDARRVAVLYFDDLSASGDLRHIADGLTEGLIAQLAQVRGLSVVSRNGIEPFRATQVGRDSIARALQAGTLVVGSVEPAGGGRIRVTTRLVDGGSGADVGRRASFEVPGDAVLSARDSIASGLSRTLREWLGEEVELRSSREATSNVAAWTALQRAERERKQAEERALAGDSVAAAALLARADSLAGAAEQADGRWIDPVIARGWIAAQRGATERGDAAATWIRAGLEHAERALSLDGTNAQALALRGTLRYRLYDLRVTEPRSEWERLLFSARDDLQAATRADPTLAQAHVTLSQVLYEPQIDDVPGALVAARRGLDEDTFLRDAHLLMERMFWASLDLEQFAEARRWCSEGAQRFPDRVAFRRCELYLMATPAMAANATRALQLVREMDSLLSQTLSGNRRRVEAQIVLGGVLARAGRKDSAMAVLSRARQALTFEIDPNRDLLSRAAYMYGLAGEYDRAIDLLKEYVAASPHHNFLETAGTVWWWRELRAQPRFNEIARSR